MFVASCSWTFLITHQLCPTLLILAWKGMNVSPLRRVPYRSLRYFINDLCESNCSHFDGLMSICIEGTVCARIPQFWSVPQISIWWSWQPALYSGVETETCTAVLLSGGERVPTFVDVTTRASGPPCQAPCARSPHTQCRMENIVVASWKDIPFVNLLCWDLIWCCQWWYSCDWVRVSDASSR